MESIIGCLVVGWILLIFLYLWILDYLHKRKVKKLKYEWTWVVKKTIVSAIKERYEAWDDWWYYYKLETKDRNENIYESEEFKNAKHGWRTVEDMKVKYDWVDYDLSDKDNVIKQLNDNKCRLEMELQNNPWFLKKRELKRDIKAMEKYIEIANEWPITPYLICNGHKISVWDPIDVYVSPEDPKLYYFDLDFTKEKYN